MSWNRRERVRSAEIPLVRTPTVAAVVRQAARNLLEAYGLPALERQLMEAARPEAKLDRLVQARALDAIDVLAKLAVLGLRPEVAGQVTGRRGVLVLPTLAAEGARFQLDPAELAAQVEAVPVDTGPDA